MTTVNPEAVRSPERPLAAVFMDLDDSIFQTLRKCRPGPVTTAALDQTGKPSSYFSFGQSCLLALLAERSVIIPTTARNRDAFDRVLFKFRYGAILNYGGLILCPDGQVDEIWHNRMKQLCVDAAPFLRDALARAENIIRDMRLNCRARIISDSGLDFYVVIKNYNSHVEELKIIMDEIEKSDFPDKARIYLNDNNLSLRPFFLDKSKAVSYFVQTYIDPEHPGLPIIGMGDSLSDLEFMQQCDFMLIPGSSQVSALLAAASEGRA